MSGRTIEVVSYDACWPERFDVERRALAARLGAVVLAIHHIGSTAVPGLAAKSIVDILLEVRSLAEIDRNEEELARLGYEAKGEYGLPGRRYFTKGDGRARTHHLHAYAHGDPNIERHLAFRDYLRARPDVATAYARIKIAAAEACAGEVDTYIAAKSPFIAIHEAAALAWHRSARDERRGRIKRRPPTGRAPHE